MSFGEGNLRTAVAELQKENAELRERIEELERLVRDMRLLDRIVTGFAKCKTTCPSYCECSVTVGDKARCIFREDIGKRMEELGIEVNGD